MIFAQFTSSCRTSGLCVKILYSLLLLWIKQMDGLSDFSNYLFRIITSHSAHACDGDILFLRCPRHSTITVQSGFYGQSEALSRIVPGMRCQWRNHSCSASTALQKVLYECQGHRDCQLLVNHHVFGRDPCPGTPKYLHVSYRCKPTEHKKKVTCEGDRLLLHCKFPKVLNIYSAVYGRQMEEEESCPSEMGEDPPFECLYHGAVDVVTNLCYGKQRCRFTIDEKHFKDPCPPGTKKYLTVLYACVPQTLLKEADPSFQTTSVPSQSTKGDKVEHPVVKSSKFPENRIIVSNSLMAYGYITEHPEMAGLLFTSSVCVGLLIILIAVSTQITCSRHLNTHRTLNKSRTTELEEEPKNQDIDDDEDDNEEEKETESLTDNSNLSEIGRKLYCWEDVTYTTEAAELMERIERRELVIQEIRMNAYLNGNTCILHSYLPTVQQNVVQM